MLLDNATTVRRVLLMLHENSVCVEIEIEEVMFYILTIYYDPDPQKYNFFWKRTLKNLLYNSNEELKCNAGKKGHKEVD